MTVKIDQTLIAELKKIKNPGDLLQEVFSRFGSRAAIGTSGQLTGSVMIHMACTAVAKPRVFTVDTERLFAETYTLFDNIEKKYGIKVERFKPNPKKIQEMIKKDGEHLFFDSKKKQEYCCFLRKVEPNREALKTLDVWLTGLRTDQSVARAQTLKFEIIFEDASRRPILKIAPLVDWQEKDLREYGKKNQVPLHSLLNWQHEGWRYESLGCRICTTPIGPHEPRRAGRWRWFNAAPDKNSPDLADKECGIHAPVYEDQ